jgi:carbonic anhydrase/acetyltransferase-like protein (isoleucine patch superfamily)
MRFGIIASCAVKWMKYALVKTVMFKTARFVASLGQGTYIGKRVSIGDLALIHACTIVNGAMIGMQAIVIQGALI